MDTPSNANVHAIVKAQIVFLLSTLTEENFEQNQLQIRTVRLGDIMCFCLRLLAYCRRRLPMGLEAYASLSLLPSNLHVQP